MSLHAVPSFKPAPQCSVCTADDVKLATCGDCLRLVCAYCMEISGLCAMCNEAEQRMQVPPGAWMWAVVISALFWCLIWSFGRGF